MCDERTQKDVDEFLIRSGVTRRQFGTLSAAAGLAMMLPPVAKAQDVTETDVDVTTPDGVADCYFVHPSTGQHPAVIIWPDILGLRPAFRAMGERLAQSGYSVLVPLRDRCSFGRFPWLISQALSVTYMAGERRLYLERNCRLPESPAHSRRRNREGPASSKGLNSQRGFGPAVEPRRKSRPRSTSLHGSSPCKCQHLSTLRWDRLPPSRPSTKSGARAGGRRLSDRRLHRWLAGTSASAPSSHGAADLLGLNRAHICVRNLCISGKPVLSGRKGTSCR